MARAGDVALTTARADETGPTRRAAYRVARAYATRIDHPGLYRALRVLHPADDRAQSVSIKRAVPFFRRRLLVDTANHLGWWIYFYGVYRRPAVLAVRAAVRPGDVVVDVGANLGDFTVALADAVGPEGHVLAFEPWPPEYERCAATIALNDLWNVELMRYAVGSRPGVTVFWGSEGFNQSQSSAAREAAAGPSAEELSARVVRLDDRLGDLPRLRLIKVAAQGAELDVLQGTEETLREKRTVVVLTALNDRLCGAFGTTVAATLAFLEARGYRVQYLRTARFCVGWLEIGRRPSDSIVARPVKEEGRA